jgi:hypothetical protein
MENQPIIVVHVHEDGHVLYYLNGEAKVFFVDDRVPDDRVYQMTEQTPREALTALIGSSPIGSRHDEHHASVVHRVRLALLSKSPLNLICADPDSVHRS